MVAEQIDRILNRHFLPAIILDLHKERPPETEVQLVLLRIFLQGRRPEVQLRYAGHPLLDPKTTVHAGICVMTETPGTFPDDLFQQQMRRLLEPDPDQDLDQDLDLVDRMLLALLVLHLVREATELLAVVMVAVLVGGVTHGLLPSRAETILRLQVPHQ